MKTAIKFVIKRSAVSRAANSPEAARFKLKLNRRRRQIKLAGGGKIYIHRAKRSLCAKGAAHSKKRGQKQASFLFSVN